MTIDNTTIAILFIVAMAGRELFVLTIRKFWKKTIETEYVTVAACVARCDTCKQGRQVKDQDLMRVMNLVRSDISKLYSAIIKQMLHNDTPNEVIEEMIGMKLGGSE